MMNIIVLHQHDATLAHSTPQSQEGSVVADSEEEGDRQEPPFTKSAYATTNNPK